MGGIVSRAAAGKDNSCSSLPQIPEDIIKTEILSRLPVSSIIRFRCVCRSWKHLLSGDPDFVKLHLNRYSTSLDNASLIVKCFTGLNLKKIPPLNSMFVELGGSVNGLVCVYDASSIGTVGLWNPAINHYKDIPIPPLSDFVRVPGAICSCFGLGFDHVANDYKVIFLNTCPDVPIVAYVYSCNSDSWGTKGITSTFLSQGDYIPCPTVVRGCPYWCVRCRYVMFFDVQDEIFRLLPAIDFYNPSTQSMVMVNLRDSLALLLTDIASPTTSKSVDVYVFNEKFHLWTKNYTIGPITVPKYMKLLHCFRNGDLLFQGGSYYIKLVAIDPHTRAISRFASGMYRYDDSRFNLTFSFGCDYMESLVSLKGMRPLHVKKVATNIVVIEKRF